MKIKTLKPTCFDGKKLKVGDEVDVDDSVAERWIENGIAKAVKTPKVAADNLKEKAAKIGDDISNAKKK